MHKLYCGWENGVRKQQKRGQLGWCPPMKGNMAGDKVGGEGRTQAV